MYESINKSLDDAREQVFRLHKINAMVEDYLKQKDLLEKKVSDLKDILEKEEKDVDQLEGHSLEHLLHKIRGNFDEKMMKEQQEALAARLKYEQAVKELEEIRIQIQSLKTEKNAYSNAEIKYQQLYEEKKSLLLHSNSRIATELLELEEQEKADQNMLKEVDEAISAGMKVTSHLKNTEESLDKAEGWGTWDMLGGGLVSDVIKHGHLDDAKSEAEQTQMALMKFRSELADIKIDSSINIATDGFAKFADFFFDGLIADWCMQSRIHDSQESVENVRSQVHMVMARLECMDRELKEKLDSVQRKIESLVEEAR